LTSARNPFFIRFAVRGSVGSVVWSKTGATQRRNGVIV